MARNTKFKFLLKHIIIIIVVLSWNVTIKFKIKYIPLKKNFVKNRKALIAFTFAKYFLCNRFGDTGVTKLCFNFCFASFALIFFILIQEHSLNETRDHL